MNGRVPYQGRQRNHQDTYDHGGKPRRHAQNGEHEQQCN